MMRIRLFAKQLRPFLTFTSFAVATVLTLDIYASTTHKDTLIIGFGSCANQNYEQPIWSSINNHNPDLFILMGDAIYPNNKNQKGFEQAYAKLAAIPGFAELRNTTPVIGTWDDHDYGGSNSGESFLGKQGSKKEFIKFFNYAEVNALKKLDQGIYHTRWIDFNDKKIQIILLDTRWYRSPLVYTYLSEPQRKALNLGPIEPNRDKTSTILGAAQWSWLESELQKPADLKIIVSSIQVIAEFTGWEAWANYPHERTKLLKMFDQYVDTDIIILSGEIHRAEISRQLYTTKSYLDITSSGLAVRTYPSALNKHREGQTLETLNYGMLYIEDTGFNNKNLLNVKASVFDVNGIEQLSAKLKEQ